MTAKPRRHIAAFAAARKRMRGADIQPIFGGGVLEEYNGENENAVEEPRTNF